VPDSPALMKLLVFAHTPPPHHGQSYMVQLMLAGLGGDRRKFHRATSEDLADGLPQDPRPHGIACYHVNARLSKKLEDIGDLRVGKVFLLLGYCLQAIWCRFRYGVTNFYYIPAPGKRSALYRDWMVMLLCRPFFKRIILHWHAAGLAKWLETVVQMRSRALTYQLMKQVDLSIVLSNYNRRDAEKLFSRQIQVVSNGIPDPCPHFESEVLPRRKARFAARQKLLSGEDLTAPELESSGGDPYIFKVLFLAHCTREKGLFDTLDAVALANAKLALSNQPLRMHLTVAGEFLNAAEQREFVERIARPDLELPDMPLGGAGSIAPEVNRLARHSCVTYKGFVSGKEKNQVYAESDCLCFPTYYYAESFGLVLVEALAFGLLLVTTRWRSIPELLPCDYPGLVDIRSPEKVAAALLVMVAGGGGESFRERFIHHFTLERHLASLVEAIQRAEPAPISFPPEIPGDSATG
jgi:glycosyltransferase involved in cell wall biosynthesis